MKRHGALAGLVLSAVVPVLAAFGGVIGLSGCASCQSTVRQVSIPAVAAGSFDGVEGDQTGHRLYLADRTTNKVDVIDISSADPWFKGAIDVGGPPNGLAVAPLWRSKFRVWISPALVRTLLIEALTAPSTTSVTL